MSTYPLPFGATAHTGAEDMRLPNIDLGPVGHVAVDCRFERMSVLFPHTAANLG